MPISSHELTHAIRGLPWPLQRAVRLAWVRHLLTALDWPESEWATPAQWAAIDHAETVLDLRRTAPPLPRGPVRDGIRAGESVQLGRTPGTVERHTPSTQTPLGVALEDSSHDGTVRVVLGRSTTRRMAIDVSVTGGHLVQSDGTVQLTVDTSYDPPEDMERVALGNVLLGEDPVEATANLNLFFHQREPVVWARLADDVIAPWWATTSDVPAMGAFAVTTLPPVEITRFLARAVRVDCATYPDLLSVLAEIEAWTETTSDTLKREVVGRMRDQTVIARENARIRACNQVMFALATSVPGRTVETYAVTALDQRTPSEVRAVLAYPSLQQTLRPR